MEVTIEQVRSLRDDSADSLAILDRLYVQLQVERRERKNSGPTAKEIAFYDTLREGILRAETNLRSVERELARMEAKS